MKRILITGANSYIGTSFENYIKANHPNEYTVDTVDMFDSSWRDKDFSGYDTVFDVAGIAHSDNGKITEEKKKLYYSINTELTVEIAKKAKNDGVKQFIFMSSAIVYGDSAPIGENRIITKDTMVSPANCYGDSKVQAEKAIIPLNDASYKVVIIRSPMIYGRNSKGNFSLLLKIAEKIPFFPLVENQRSMLYVENLCEFVRLMIENNESGIFHPQNSEYVNTSKMVKCIAKHKNKKVRLIKGFTPLLKLTSHFTGLVNKAFGNFLYDKDLSKYNYDYQIENFDNSVKKSVDRKSNNKKALIIASVASMIDQFNMSIINSLTENGYDVDVACNFVSGNTCDENRINKLKIELDNLGVGYYQVDFSRNPLNLKVNFKAYKQICSIIKDDYGFVHCHSPIGGIIGRIAAHKNHIPVAYTAHGFHFYKGAPLKNWLIYYPIEKFCSRFTDLLITINKEDYALAQKRMKAKKIAYVFGVGINTGFFRNTSVDKKQHRLEICVPKDAVLLLSVGELNKNKNHKTVIRALAKIKSKNIHYVIAGRGDLKGSLLELAKELNISENIHILGFRDDIAKLYKAADIYIHPSFREGLPVSVMEAMASGLPCIVSRIRGNIDLVSEHEELLTFEPQSVDECAQKIGKMVNEGINYKKIGEINQEKSLIYDVEQINKNMLQLYDEMIHG